MDDEGRVVCGDAVEVLRTLPDRSAALTVTSPPYYQHRDYGMPGQLGREASLGEYLDRIAAVLRELLRITDETGSCFVVVGDTYRNRKLLLVPHRIALVADEVGWTIRNDIVWSKKDPAPDSPRNRWRSAHEHILFLTKRPSGYRFNADAARIPYSPATQRRWGAGQSYGGPKSAGRKNARDSRMRDGRVFQLNANGCLPTDVWSTACARASVHHYATFPEPLIRPIIQVCSNTGDLVVDPFAGSGTACRAALEMGRRCVGIELNPEYAALANRGLQTIERKQAG